MTISIIVNLVLCIFCGYVSLRDFERGYDLMGWFMLFCSAWSMAEALVEIV